MCLKFDHPGSFSASIASSQTNQKSPCNQSRLLDGKIYLIHLTGCIHSIASTNFITHLGVAVPVIFSIRIQGRRMMICNKPTAIPSKEPKKLTKTLKSETAKNTIAMHPKIVVITDIQKTLYKPQI